MSYIASLFIVSGALILFSWIFMIWNEGWRYWLYHVSFVLVFGVTFLIAAYQLKQLVDRFAGATP